MANSNTQAQATADDLRDCDLIMRGGITSGVVYPGVLTGLACQYRFRNIGGASAGAIAAGVAAAAEYGRLHAGKHGIPADFDPFVSIVDKIPQQIGGALEGQGGTSMRRLFQPIAAMAPLSDLLWAYLGKNRLALVFAVLRLILPALIVGAGVLLAALLLLTGPMAHLTTLQATDPYAPVVWQLLMLVAVLCGLLAGLATLRRTALRLISNLRDSSFGLASGINPALYSSAAQGDALMQAYLSTGGFADWLHATIQQCAGRAVDTAPLTMGDLWGSKDALAQRREIDLLLTTTNLSQQIPHTFPFLERTQSRLYFRPADLARVLPKPVLRHMVQIASRGEPGGSTVAVEQDHRFLRLPPASDLPVILGVRLSLSFPGLISAVRLYEGPSFDRSPKRTDGGMADTQAQPFGDLMPCWFSDGGITSNFPVTSFDSPLPLRPTFCISLADLPLGADPATTNRVRIVRSNSAAIRAEHMVDLDSSGLAEFAAAIVASARNGHENELVTMPGHRDRIATILLDPKSEGGLNLAMTADTIGKLAGYGREAAYDLIDHFGGAQTTSRTYGWQNHRWVRVRALLAAMERQLVQFNGQWNQDDAPDRIIDLINSTNADLPSYRWRDENHRTRAIAMAERIAKLAKDMTEIAPDRSTDSVFDGERARPGAWKKTRGAPLPVVRQVLRPGGSDPRA